MKDNELAKIDESLELLNLQAEYLREFRETIIAKNKEIAELNKHISELNNAIANAKLDKKYSKALVFIQRIDDAFRNLDANIASPNFENNVRICIDEVFRAYGYRFTDYSEQTQDMYECEYQPIEAPEVIFRAVTHTDGSVAVKGKVFLPKKF